MSKMTDIDGVEIDDCGIFAQFEEESKRYISNGNIESWISWFDELCDNVKEIGQSVEKRKRLIRLGGFIVAWIDHIDSYKELKQCENCKILEKRITILEESLKQIRLMSNVEE